MFGRRSFPVLKNGTLEEGRIVFNRMGVGPRTWCQEMIGPLLVSESVNISHRLSSER